ncbi:MAG: hypothetical protein ACFFCS_03790 [Candidatus Hodarchaeota archaeon]
MQVHLRIKIIAGLVVLGAFFSITLVNQGLTAQHYSKKETIEITTDDGVTISTTVFYPKSFSESGNYPAIISAHGDGASKEVMNLACIELVKRGWIVYNFDFRNHGHSEGSE